MTGTGERESFNGGPSTAWPFVLAPEEAAFVALCKFYVALPYGGLGNELMLSSLTSPDFLRPMSEYIPNASTLVREDRPWTLLSEIARTTATMSQDRRDAIAIEVVLGEDFISGELEMDQALYWRRVDVALEALGSLYSAHEIIDFVLESAERLAEESHTPLLNVLTSSDIADLAEIAHETQMYFTGIYIPGADEALRWGQRQIAGLRNEELILTVAADVARLKHREVTGDLDSIRRYGELLADDIREMSTSQAHGRTPDERARQIRVFTTLLGMVSSALGEDDDGLAPDSAPDFEGMRLNEVRELATAMAINLVERDGHRGPEEEDSRSVWNADNWYVKAQAPSPGAELGRRRRVSLWLLKHHEHNLSPSAREDHAEAVTQ